MKPLKKRRITAFQVCGKASVHVELFDEAGMETEHLRRVAGGCSRLRGRQAATFMLKSWQRKTAPIDHFLTPWMSHGSPVFCSLLWRLPNSSSENCFRTSGGAHNGNGGPKSKLGARIQRERMLKTFLWHIRQSEDADGSPWMHLKSTIPDSDWFLRDNFDLRKPDTFLKN